MSIKDLSNRRRLPRAGTIRLGIKKTNKEGKEYPAEVDYFVCPIEIQRVYGAEPKELPIMFPVEDEQLFFPQFYNYYGKGVLLCRGDGEGEGAGTFWNFDEGKYDKRFCPCELLESGKCKAVGRLQFLLPEIKGAMSVWQINTSSKNSIIDINSGIDVVRGFVGRVAMIPLLLKRVPIDTTKFEGDKVVKGKHFTMKLDLGITLLEVQKLGQIPVTRALLPQPDESQPEDLFPKNGHDPDGKGEVIEGNKLAETEEEETESEIVSDDLKDELSDTLRMYRDCGGHLTQTEEDRVDALVDKAGYEKAIEHFKKKTKKLEPGLFEGEDA